jgi:hypothetical protein
MRLSRIRFIYERWQYLYRHESFMKKGIIISSVEGLAIAKNLQNHFAHFNMVSWTDSIFNPTVNILDNLIDTAKKIDFAIFIFTSDDLIISRGQRQQSARDNILFEFGIYLGLLGRKNVFAVMPSDENFKIPSDLQGLTYISYSTKQAGSLISASNHIKRILKEPIESKPQTKVKSKPKTPLKPKTKEDKSKENHSSWNVFLSYSRKDKVFKDELNNHLSQLRRNKRIKSWNDYEILPAQEWEAEILKNLNKADLILLLISSDFLASDYCNKEMLLALERHKKGTSIVVPIILRACDWLDTEFAILNALPVGGQPIKLWEDQDRAFLDVVLGIKRLIA